MSFQNALELWNGIDLEIVEDSNETIHCCFYLHLVSLKIACVNGICMYMNEIKLLLFFLLKVVSASQELICNTMWWLYKAIICVMYICKTCFFYSNIPMLIYMYFIYCQYHVNVRICNWAFKTKFLSCLYRLYVFKNIWKLCWKSQENKLPTNFTLACS